MPHDAISVTLGTGSGPYQKTLALSLLREGMLRRVLSSGLVLEIQEPGPNGSLEVTQRFPVSNFVNRALWAVWRRVPGRFLPSPAMFSALLSDYFWSRRIPPCTIYHGWSGCEPCLLAAKRLGAITLVENPARHPRHWHLAGVEECKRFGVAPRDHSVPLSSRLIHRMLREFELCDRIIVPSSLSYRSFEECGLADKTVVVTTAVDTESFTPQPRPEHRPLFRACFVGRVEMAKGVGYLLQAWKKLALANAELVLVGAVKPEMNSLLRTHADSTVRLTGSVPAQEVARLYRESDLFVFPSVNEGFAQVLMEAMASGLAVVASDYSGATDCVSDGKEGFIVPVRDVDRLAEAIWWCYQHPDETRAMGLAARARIEGHFTLDHYSQRQIALYRKLAGERAGQAT